MPNWCDNTISISGPAEKVSQIYQQLKTDDSIGLCQVLYPAPDDMFTGNLGEKERKDCAKKGIPNWYDWQTSNWGTKWDTADGDWQYEEAGDGEAILSGSFQTAWAPPIGVYEHCDEAHNDLYIEAMYYEPGCAFAGKWDSGNGDEHYSLEGTKESLENELPEDLNDAFGITEYMEEEPEELSEWMREGAESKKELENV
jgi:hypothetical protein